MNNIIEEKVTKVASYNGIDVYNIKTNKFKTNSINIFFHDNLSRENASKNALIPAVLRRGCVPFPSFQEIALYLEGLYGAAFDCGVVKKGERQIIQFYTEFVADEYTVEKADLLENTFNLLIDIITNPVLESGHFKTEYVAQEKENLKRLIEGRVNDKVQYAVDKCFEEMCRDERFGIFEYGAVSDLDSIDAANLYEHYKTFLESLPISIYFTGNTSEERIKALTGRLSGINRNNLKNVDISKVGKDVKEIKNITEKMSVNQAKLSLGFRTNTASNDKDYYSLLVYNGILGGGMHSKLFQNVREKGSLAYYVFSRLEKFKGLMVISSGIESQNKDKAMDIILRQIDDIKNGEISDYEFDSTIKTIETGVKSLRDSQLHIVDFYLSQAVVDTNDSFSTIIEKVKNVSKEDVIDISKRVVLDTVYFLTGY
ncbi:MAG: insulinase family protein [Clostridia bacterium]|nr:insulinase family protein [Clostridia bacterium]